MEEMRAVSVVGTDGRHVDVIKSHVMLMQLIAGPYEHTRLSVLQGEEEKEGGRERERLEAWAVRDKK